MMNKRTFALLFLMALVAWPGLGQRKTSQPPHSTQTVPLPAPAVPDETAPAEPRAVEASSPAGASGFPFQATILIAAVIFLLAAVAFVLQMQRATRAILKAPPRGDDARQDRDRVMKELAVLRNDMRDQIAALRATVEEIPARVQQRVQNVLSPQKPTTPAPAAPARPPETYEPARPIEDPSAQLLTIANQIIQQTPATLEAFQASTRQLSVRVFAWTNPADGALAAFIVEHRGSYYAIPNVIKPARLPQEWFNRSEFGVNDEIQRVVVLPRLRRAGSGYEVAAPGVFAR
jgi:hypothetical protein